jgi:hypothetical protein
MHQVPKSTPEAVSVQLESFSEPITMYRFDAVQQLQQHLPDAIFMVISKLNVNPDHRWDQTIPPPLICAKSQMDHGMVRLYRASSDGHQVCLRS